MGGGGWGGINPTSLYNGGDMSLLVRPRDSSNVCPILRTSLVLMRGMGLVEGVKKSAMLDWGGWGLVEGGEKVGHVGW